jgi:hypothetical protein
LDLMPTDAAILGFGNRWYRSALENAQRVHLGEHEIGLITAAYFVATKLEPSHGRGRGDFHMSHDMADIVTVIDGRPELVQEIRLTPAEVQRYLSDEFRTLLSDRDFLEAVPGHLLRDAASQRRRGLVIDRLNLLVLEG